jgi:predicted nucleotide-binding protein
MVTKRTPPTPKMAALNSDQMKRGIARIQRVIGDIEAFDVTTLTKRWGREQQALEASIEGTLTSVFGYDTVEYRRYRRAASLDNGAISMSIGAYGPRVDEGAEARRHVAEGKDDSIQLLRQAVRWLEDEVADAAASTPGTQTLAIAENPKLQSQKKSQKIFIVHGHDEVALQTVARFVERIGFEAIILREQANQGRTIIEKIEANSDVGLAVVLLTPDDEGSKRGSTLRPRPRQNVLLELGYFLAHLGRSKVCVLASPGDMDIPTDFAGVVWEPLDDGGAWKQSFARELSAAGFDLDWNKVMRP